MLKVTNYNKKLYSIEKVVRKKNEIQSNKQYIKFKGFKEAKRNNARIIR